VWQPRGLPATFLVDPVGNIQYQALGGREWEKPEYLEFLRGLSQQKEQIRKWARQPATIPSGNKYTAPRKTLTDQPPAPHGAC